MRDRFVGDIGDFGKYGLLRALAGVQPRCKPELHLGVVWYEVDRGIRYFNRPDSFRDCDKPLFDELQRLVASSWRSIAAFGGLRRGAASRTPAPGNTPQPSPKTVSFLFGKLCGSSPLGLPPESAEGRCFRSGGLVVRAPVCFRSPRQHARVAAGSAPGDLPVPVAPAADASAKFPRRTVRPGLL